MRLKSKLMDFAKNFWRISKNSLRTRNRSKFMTRTVWLLQNKLSWTVWLLLSEHAARVTSRVRLSIVKSRKKINGSELLSELSGSGSWRKNGRSGGLKRKRGRLRRGKGTG